MDGFHYIALYKCLCSVVPDIIDCVCWYGSVIKIVLKICQFPHNSVGHVVSVTWCGAIGKLFTHTLMLLPGCVYHVSAVNPPICWLIDYASRIKLLHLVPRTLKHTTQKLLCTYKMYMYVFTYLLTYTHTCIHTYTCVIVISLGGYICSYTILFSFSPDKLIATFLFICLFTCHVCDYANKDYIYFPKRLLQTRKFLLAWNSMLVCYNVIIAGCWQTEWCLSQKGNYSLWRFVCLLRTCGASAVPCMSD